MATTATYRKTKQGEWVVYGSAREVKPGATVYVATKAGKRKPETIVSVGKPFQAPNGDRCVYGYLGRSDHSGSTWENPRRPRECDECGEPAERGTYCWETGLAH